MYTGGVLWAALHQEVSKFAAPGDDFARAMTWCEEFFDCESDPLDLEDIEQAKDWLAARGYARWVGQEYRLAHIVQGR